MIDPGLRHSKWPWPKFKVKAVSNSIRLSWKFVWLLLTSTGIWIFHYFWLTCKMCVYVRISVKPAGQRVSLRGENFNVTVFFDTNNMINVKLCMMVVLIELYPFITLSVTLIAFQGQTSFREFNWKYYVLIRISWTFVWLLTTASKSWIYPDFWLQHMFRGDDWPIF